MKKTAITTLSNRKTRLSAGQARLSEGQVNVKKANAPVSTVTFKGGLKNINLKYACSNVAYKPLEQWCETALADACTAWLRACTGGKSALGLPGGSIRSIRNVLAHHIGDSELLYVMNAYIYGVINTASLTDALCITSDYENYISSNSTLTGLQKNILLQGFRGFTKDFTKRRREKEE